MPGSLKLQKTWPAASYYISDLPPLIISLIIYCFLSPSYINHCLMYMSNCYVRPLPWDLVFGAPVLNFTSSLTGEELYAASTIHLW